jgi:hypothetical protein
MRGEGGNSEGEGREKGGGGAVVLRVKMENGKRI